MFNILIVVYLKDVSDKFSYDAGYITISILVPVLISLVLTTKLVLRTIKEGKIPFNEIKWTRFILKSILK